MKSTPWTSLALLIGALGVSPLPAQTFDFDPVANSTDYDTQPPAAGWNDQDYDDRDYDDQDDDDRYDDDQDYDDRDYDDRYDDSTRTPRAEVGFFYDELSPYGEWVLTRSHGWAWFPRHVHAGWRPYNDGRWVDTDYGWTWASYEPFGWATYHYGRWVRDSRFGWLWVPGRVWGPAWVSWQYGDGYVGWAPLPPAVDFEIGLGLRLGGFDLSVGIRPDSYNFVPERSFLDTRLSRHRVPTARNVTIIHNTTNITQYNSVDNRVINRGVDPRRIEQVTGRRAPRLRIAESRSKARTEVAAGELRLYRADKQKLDAVRVAPPSVQPRGDRERRSPTAVRAAPTAVQVAPRTARAPRLGAREAEKNERRDQQELARQQGDEKRRLQALQGDEMAKAREAKQRDAVQKRHLVETRAQQQEQKKAAQQLDARQKAQRRAELKPPAEAPPTEPANPQAREREPKRERRPQADKPKPKTKPPV